MALTPSADHDAVSHPDPQHPATRTDVGLQGGHPGPQRTRWSSIERQVPLLVCALLLPVVAGLLAWCYSENRHSLLVAAMSRLDGAAETLAKNVGQGAERPGDARRINEEDSAILLCLREPGNDNLRPAARRQLGNVLRRPPGVAELWSPDGTLVERVTLPARPEGAPLELHSYPPTPPRGAPGVQKIQAVGSTPFFEIVIEVRGGGASSQASAPAAAPLLGRVVLRRSLLGNNSRELELLADLIGDNTLLLLANRDGDGAWTDLKGVVPARWTGAHDLSASVYLGPDGTRRVGAGMEIKGTPWVVWLESDAAQILAAGGSALRRMTVLGLLALLLVGGGAWLLSRRVTAPLREATAAAEDIAAGHFERRVQPRGPEEIGRLADAFNVMAGRIEEGRRELEDRVATRTAELHTTLARLQEAQDSLVRKEKLAILGQLAGGVGHELRNPLGVMTNAVFYLEMVLQQAPGEVREYLGILRHQIELSEKIISDLLDFARSKPAQARAVHLDQLAAEQIGRLGPLTVTVDMDFPPDLPPAWADAVQAGQVVNNLLTNALQSMAESGGSLTLRGRNEPGDRVRLEISDTGPGVPAELRDRIFEPLFTTRARGIGLGLSVSRRLAENNGGELRLEEPSASKGATFSLVLPMAAKHAHV